MTGYIYKILVLLLGIPSLVFAQENVWEHVGAPQTIINARMLEVGPHIVIVGVDGSLYQTDDGVQFLPLDLGAQLGTSPMALNCVSVWEQALLVGCFNAYLSDDQIQTFHPMPLPATDGTGWTLVSLQTSVFAFAGRQMMVSRDEGHTFRNAHLPSGVIDATSVFKSGERLVLLGESRNDIRSLYLSSDGRRWAKATSQDSSLNIVAARAAGDVVFVADENGISYRVDARIQTPSLEPLATDIDILTATELSGQIIAIDSQHTQVMVSQNEGRTWTSWFSNLGYDHSIQWTSLARTSTHILVLGVEVVSGSSQVVAVRRSIANLSFE